MVVKNPSAERGGHLLDFVRVSAYPRLGVKNKSSRFARSINVDHFVFVNVATTNCDDWNRSIPVGSSGDVLI